MNRAVWWQVHLMEWVRAVVATTLGVAPMGQLPPIIMQQEVPSIWDQIREPSLTLGQTIVASMCNTKL